MQFLTFLTFKLYVITYFNYLRNNVYYSYRGIV